MDAPAGQRIGYARVSAPDQSLDRQIDALGGVDRLFTDEASGSTRDRAGLRALIDYVRDGDTVMVTSMDRLARSVRDLRDLVDRPGGADPTSDLLLGVLGAVAEFERAIIRERQAEGIAAARRRGVYARRRPRISAATAADIRRLDAEGVPKTLIAARTGLSRAAVYRVLDGTYTPDD